MSRRSTAARLTRGAWAREGIITQRRSGGWQWTDAETGERLASISYYGESDAVILSFTMDGTPMRQRVPILTTACHYGGRRYWFGCPCCGRRVAVLYLRQRGFACRRCNRIAYASQSGDEIDRTWRKQAKLERRLGANWSRPKGMHSTTHDRIVQGIIDCEERRDAALVLAVRRLGLVL